MNEVILLGRLTKDIELTQVGSNNTPKATFSLAIDRGKDKNGNDLGADFPRIVAWGNLATNTSKFVGKGCRVIVNGKLSTGSYKDGSGNTVYTTEVVAEQINFIDFKSKDDAHASAPVAPAPAPVAPAPAEQTEVW